MVIVTTEMCNCYMFDVKHLKWKIIPGRNSSGDESKRAEVLIVDLLLTSSQRLNHLLVPNLQSNWPESMISRQTLLVAPIKSL